MLAERTKLISPPKTSGMRSRANRLKAEGVHIINFAAGELDVDTCDSIKNAAYSSIKEGNNKYTETFGIAPLRKKIAESVSRSTGVLYNPSEIGVTAGAKQALFNTAMMLFQQGDEVIIPSPCWSTFPTQVAVAGAVPVLLDTSKNGYDIDTEALKRLITDKTRGLILNSPNNPTGKVYDKKTLAKVADLAIVEDLWVVFDECYSSIVYPPHQHYNIVFAREEMKSRTVIVNSFSKTYALTGWRIGFVAAPEELITAMQRFQGHTTSNANCIAQYGVMATFETGTEDFVENVGKILRERREIGLRILGENPNITLAAPQGAFYFYVDMSQYMGCCFEGVTIDSSDDMAELLLEHAHIAIVPGSGFGDHNGLRISYAVSTEDVEKGLVRFCKFLDRIKLRSR